MYMPRRVHDETCAVAHALGVLSDGWTVLIVRDLARGIDRFDELVASLSISRKVLTATTEPDTAEAHRVHSLAGTRIPELRLTSTAGPGG